VVGTLDNLYTQLAEGESGPAEPRPFDLRTALAAAAATVPQNLGALADAVTDPLGLDIGTIDDTEAAARSQEVNAGVFGAMAARFDGQAGAFAYLLFILLYFPCVATLGAIRREAGGAWAAFVAVWTTGIAYASATLFYQTARFSAHPLTSTLWILGLLIALILVVYGLRRWAVREQSEIDGAEVGA
jgi:ferrous iron transport protein B